MNHVYVIRYYGEPDIQQGLSRIRALGQALGEAGVQKREIGIQFKGLEITVNQEIPLSVLEQFRAYEDVKYFRKVDTNKAEWPFVLTRPFLV